jgi:hypothetical protein
MHVNEFSNRLNFNFIKKDYKNSHLRLKNIKFKSVHESSHSVQLFKSLTSHF